MEASKLSVKKNPSVLAALANVGDDDPAIFLDWNVANLDAAVNWANANQPALPIWYAGGAGTYPITAYELQHELAAHLASFGGDEVQGNGLLAPNTLLQSNRIVSKMSTLMVVDQFLIDICGGGAGGGGAARSPLATAYMIFDSKRNTRGERMNLPFAGGVQFFD